MEKHTAEAVGIILGAMSAFVVAVIYSLKNCRESKCWGVHIKQQVFDGQGAPVRSCSMATEV